MPKLIAFYEKKGNITSNDKLAAALLDAYGNLDWGTTKPRSLGVRLGHIEKGETGWWQKRPSLVKALAEFLDTPAEDLGLHPQEAGDTYRFPEFPELLPLNLAQEPPCDIGGPVGIRDNDVLDLWLGQGPAYGMVRQPHSGVYWLHFPSGRGVDLFWAHLQRHSKYETRRTHMIRDAQASLKQSRHLILRIDADGGDQDLHTLATMNRDMALLIVAPHAAPLRANPDSIHTHYLWERYNGPMEARRELDLTADPFAQIMAYEWRPHPDWIKRLLSWIEKRMDTQQADTHFTAEEIQRWLQKFPDLKRQITGPGDVLRLSRLLHHLPTSKWPKVMHPEAGKLLLKHILPPSEIANGSYRELSLRAWKSKDTNWGEPLPLASWKQIAKSLPISTQENLKALIDEEDRANREKIVRQIRRQPPPPDVDRLTDLHMLTSEPGDRYSLRPAFLPWLLARDHVIDCMTQQELESWALQCFDPKRRSAVDAALDALTLDQLIPIAEKLPTSLSGNATGIGAAEALFYSIGRRIKSGDHIPPALLSIAPRVLSHIAPEFPLEDLEPWSRDTKDADDQIQWLAICWAWSLLPRPESLPASVQNSWLFPGWSNDLDDASHWGLLDSLIDDKKGFQSAYSQPILQIAMALTERLEKPPKFSPALLHPYLIAEATKGRWPFEPDWWTKTFDKPWAEQILIEQLVEIPAQRLSGLLSSLMGHVLSIYKQNKHVLPAFLLSPIRVAIMRRLPPETLECSFTDEERNLLLIFPESLPPAFRSEALAFLLPLEKHHDAYAEKLISLSSEADTLTLLSWLDTKKWGVAARRIWQISPNQAKSVLSNANQEPAQRIRALLLTCPDPSYSIALMKLNKDLFQPQDLKEFVRHNLHFSGELSRDLMDLLA